MPKDKLKKVSKAHQRYYLQDGTLVPGATTVLSLLNKPALVKWANNLGLQGIDSTKYVNESAEIGTLVHSMVECYCLKKKCDTTNYTQAQIELAQVGFNKFKEWASQHEIEPIGNEIQLVSEKHKFGGTLDFLAKVDGIVTLIDFKTGSGIYKEHFCQTSAYFKMAVENGYKPKRIMILNIGRNEDEPFQTQEIKGKTITTYFSIFLALLKVYKLKKDLGWN